MRILTGSRIFLAVSSVLMLTAVYMVFFFAPAERTMGELQRIFYFHVPCAWIAFLAFAVTCIGSVLYIVKRDLKWDRLASSSAEVGVIFCVLALLTGTLWARPVWGVWWTWDARLTLMLVLWLIFTSYLMLRGYIEHETKRAMLSAVVGIIGFIDVPVVYFSIRWWRTQHPQPVLAGGEGSGLEVSMLITLLVCIAAFTALFFYILLKRVSLEKMREQIMFLQKLLEENK